MFNFLILQAAIAQIGAPEVVGTPLWRDFTYEMSPEQFADAMRAIPGVLKVTVKRDKKNSLKDVSVEYTAEGLSIGGPKISIIPIFENDRLQEITLIESSCFSAGMERAKIIKGSLIEKFGNNGTEVVVDSNGVKIDRRLAMWNANTRVRVSFQNWSPSQDYVYNSGHGVQGALATIANVSSAQAYQEQVNQCPSDSGRRLLISVNYSSQQVFGKVHAEELKAREESSLRTKEAL